MIWEIQLRVFSEDFSIGGLNAAEDISATRLLGWGSTPKRKDQSVTPSSHAHTPFRLQRRGHALYPHA